MSSHTRARAGELMVAAAALVLFAVYARGQWSLTTRFVRECWKRAATLF